MRGPMSGQISAQTSLRRPAERPRVLRAERHRRVGIVVEKSQIRSPAHPHRETRRQENADDRPQAVRPGVWRTQRRGRPVLGPHQSGELAAARKEFVDSRGV